MGPVRFPVSVIMCPVGPKRDSSRSFDMLGAVPAWAPEGVGKAAESPRLPLDMEAGVAKPLRDLFKKHEGTFANHVKELGCGNVSMHRRCDADQAEAIPLLSPGAQLPNIASG